MRRRYCSRNWIRPTVPKPTARNSPPVHAQVMTRPVGKNASLVPGSTNGVAAAAEAEAFAAGEVVLAVLACAKTPLTKEASVEESVVVTWLVFGEVAVRTMEGIRRGWSVALWIRLDRMKGESWVGELESLLGHGGAHQVAVDLADVAEDFELV